MDRLRNTAAHKAYVREHKERLRSLERVALSYLWNPHRAYH
jgi:hypothetical protein